MANYGLLDIMPDNLLEDNNVRNITEVIDKALKDIYPETSIPALISRIDELDGETLDLLAWQWHVDFYDGALTLEQKRNLVKTSIDQHRKKGTKAAVEQMVSIVYDSGQVKEWYEYEGEPYHFMVQVGNATINESEIARVINLVNSAKNARSVLEGVRFLKNVDASFYIGSQHNVFKQVDISPAVVEDVNILNGLFAASRTDIFKRINILPVIVHDTALPAIPYQGAGTYTYRRVEINQIQEGGDDNV
jgi:phage tail P2-like protein